MNRPLQLAGAVWLALAVAPCPSQTTPPPAKPPATTKSSDGTCIPGMKDVEGKLCPADGTPTKPSVQEQFPYPGSDHSDASKNGSQGGASAPGDKPATSQDKEAVPDAPATPAAKTFPYPGDANPETSHANGPTPGESSSSQGDAEDPANPKLEDKGSSGKKTRRAPAEKLQTDQEREAEDLKIARFYENDGNLNAAYLRARDAVRIQPDDSEAHFLLANVALKLKKRDEALTEFQAYKKLDPDGLQIKKVEKALEDLK